MTAFATRTSTYVELAGIFAAHSRRTVYAKDRLKLWLLRQDAEFQEACMAAAASTTFGVWRAVSPLFAAREKERYMTDLRRAARRLPPMVW